MEHKKQNDGVEKQRERRGIDKTDLVIAFGRMHNFQASGDHEISFDEFIRKVRDEITNNDRSLEAGDEIKRVIKMLRKESELGGVRPHLIEMMEEDQGGGR